MLGARTGGANDRHWIDDLQITTGLFTAGVFNGLFLYYEDRQIRHEASGFVGLKLTPRGTYSGYLLLAGVRYPLKGAFDLATLSTRLELPRPGSTTLKVELTLENKDAIRGVVSDGIWSASLEADRQVWDKKVNKAGQYAGQYTTLLRAGSGPSEPNGFGYGTLTVDPAGGIKFLGSLGDGTKVTQKVTVSRRGMWPLYLPSYKGQGSVIGWIPVSNTDEGRGSVVWTKKSGVPGPLYPNGFILNSVFYVGPYTPPPAGTRIINITTDQVEFGGNDIAAPFVSEFALTPENKVVDLSANRLSIKFATKNGLFTGTVIEPGGGAKIKFSGVVYQPEDVAAGLVIGLTTTSAVIIGD